MSIAERTAIEAARHFAQARDRTPWDEATVEVYADEVEGRSAWVVKAADTDPAEGEPWMRTVWAPVRYFVDRNTGELVGFATERSRTIFKAGDRRSSNAVR